MKLDIAKYLLQFIMKLIQVTNIQLLTFHRQKRNLIYVELSYNAVFSVEC